MWKVKFVYVLNYLKTLKTVHKSNPRTHSPQQGKPCWRQLPFSKSLVPYGCKDNCSSFTFVYQIGSFQNKTEKVNTTIEFCILEFQLKPTILTFWTKFHLTGCFQSKAEKINITIEFCMFELVELPNFSLHWRFRFL